MKTKFSKYFFRQAKKVFGKRDFVRVAQELSAFLQAYEYKMHDEIGHGFLKIRFECSLQKGKKIRIICLLIRNNDVLIPLSLYAKSNQENISWGDVNGHLERVIAELEE